MTVLIRGMRALEGYVRGCQHGVLTDTFVV